MAEMEIIHRSEPTSPIRVLLVDGHALFRQAVRASLEEAPDIVVVGEAADAAEVEDDDLDQAPDVALVESSGSEFGPARTTSLLKHRWPACRVVVLGDEDPSTLIDVVEAGASGYVTEESGLAELIATTRSVYEGDTLIPPRMLGPLVSGLMSRRLEEHEALERLSHLTQREREVLGLLAAGADNQGIAEALSISPETARTHVQNLLGKLGVHSRLEAAAFALQARTVSPGGAAPKRHQQATPH
jgi:DNA-binding NarL/FixJ family response regulator